MWGPFRIHQVVYERSLGVKEILDSGAAEYRAISTPGNLLVSDCIHAVAAIDPVFGRGHYPLIRIGKPASRFIARQVMTRSVFDQWQGDHSWLVPRLGLDRYPIEVRPTAADPQTDLFPLPCPGLSLMLVREFPVSLSESKRFKSRSKPPGSPRRYILATNLSV